MRKKKQTVFIVNKSSHDFSPAERFGDISFLSEGSMDKYATNNMVRIFSEKLVKSDKGDFIVPCSLNIMNIIACSIFASLHGRLNLLLYKDGKYVVRNHVFR